MKPIRAHVHEHKPEDAGFAFKLGIALNAGFVLIEAIYGWRSESLALLADAGHNLSDVAGLVLAWAGMYAGTLRPDDRHTYGWQRASILASFANALLLLVALGALILEAIQRLGAPQAFDSLTVIVVAGLGVAINGATALLFMSGRERDLNRRGAFLHMAADALVSFTVVAAAAVYHLTGWAWLDPAMSLLIALLIMVGTWSLFRQSLHLMFDGVPEEIDLTEVDAYLRSLAEVNDVHDLHIWPMSTSGTALTAHLVTPGGFPGDDFIQTVAMELCRRFGIAHPTLQIEIARLEDDCRPPPTP
jgi:cobalt-zinc-cadmium efflux system protein